MGGGGSNGLHSNLGQSGTCRKSNRLGDAVYAAGKQVSHCRELFYRP